MQVSESKARALFVALGLNQAKKWPTQRLEERLNKLGESEFAETELDDDEQQALLSEVVAANEASDVVEVAEDEEAAPAEKPKKKSAKKEEVAPPKKKSAKKEAAAPTKKGKKPVKEEDGDEVSLKKKVEKLAKKPKAPPKPKKPGIPGVRMTRTRPYLAGLVLKQAAGSASLQDLLRVGVTEDMVAALNEAYSVANDLESMFCLRNAFGAIRGFITKNNEADLEPVKKVEEE